MKKCRNYEFFTTCIFDAGVNNFTMLLNRRGNSEMLFLNDCVPAKTKNMLIKHARIKYDEMSN